MISLKGKIAVVTGGGKGIGRAVSMGLAREGADVVVIDTDPQAASETSELIKGFGIRSLWFEASVTDRKAIDSVADIVSERLGNVTLVVNNAGILLRGNFDDVDAPDLWDLTINTNLKGPFIISRAFLDSLKKTKGSIINVASIHSFVAVPNSVAYTASKGGISQLTKALAIELGKYGIRVNAVAPGIIGTDMTVKLRSDENKLKDFLKRVPLSRVGNVDDVANAIAFLASDMASYITGVTLPVDGGYLAN